MSGHGNGKGNGNGNGKGIRKKTWNLVEDGMLWKAVLEYTSQDFKEQAKELVVQLHESVQPADALQGLLLDRIAAGYLRKQLILEAEAAASDVLIKEKLRESSRYSPEAQKRIAAACSVPVQSPWSGNVLRYEALLDQALHRDLILLLQLKKVAAAAVTAQTPPGSDRGLIEGETANSGVGRSSALS